MYEELVKKLRDDAENHWHMHPISTVNEYFVDAINQAADAIEDLIAALTASNEVIAKSKPRWISVTERLPEEREWVLCQCRANIRMVLRLQNGYWHQDSRHEFMSGFVTHWMPLPEPPKEENK